jgi:hypothetical protein
MLVRSNFRLTPYRLWRIARKTAREKLGSAVPASIAPKKAGRQEMPPLPFLSEPAEPKNLAAVQLLYQTAQSTPARAKELQTQASNLASALRLPTAVEPGELLSVLQLYAWLETPALEQLMLSLRREDVQAIPPAKWLKLTRSAFGKNPVALEKLASLMDGAPLREPLLVAAAAAYSRTWRLEDARRTAEAVLRDFPQNVTALNLLAEALSHIGDIAGAIAQTKRVLGINQIDYKAVRRLRALNCPDADSYGTPEYVYSRLPLTSQTAEITLDAAWMLSDAFYLDQAFDMDRLAQERFEAESNSKQGLLLQIMTHAAHVPP